jgi:hypothetical protein
MMTRRGILPKDTGMRISVSTQISAVLTTIVLLSNNGHKETRAYVLNNM